MRRLLATITIISAFVGILVAQETDIRRIDDSLNAVEQLQQARASVSQNEPRQKPQRRKVDIMADEVCPYNDDKDSIVYFLGNFAAHHNGAVISCDSAVRYGDSRIGFFGRVIINQDSIYIYGDSAVYDGVSNIAEIYAPIVKVIDGDALLYTYNFTFNTAEKIGKYYGGGVLVQDNDIMESLRGYYYADSHDVICVEQVEMHGADYDMKSDSAIFNTDTKLARFFTNSEIWNADGDYLSADEGHYDQSQNLYMVTRNGYILSKEQEMWGDSIAYYRTDGHVIAHGNIQMDDFKNKIIAFGDYAEYWQEKGNALLTKDPSAISYDTSQSDSVFMRADSMQLLTINRYEPEEQSNDTQSKQPEKSTKNVAPKSASNINSGNSPAERKAPSAFGKSADEHGSPAVDSLSQDSTAADSVAIDSIAVDTTQYTAKQLKEKQKEAARKAKEAKKREEAAIRKVKLDSIAVVRQAKITEMLKQFEARERERASRDSLRLVEKRAKLIARKHKISIEEAMDSIAIAEAEHLHHDHDSAHNEVNEDSITLIRQAIANQARGLTSEEEPEQVDTTQLDSIYRLVKAFRNVKMYRSDAQMICDSLVSNSTDSIIHLYLEPVMWNNDNQIAAKQVDVYTRNQQIERAEFLNEPIMIAQVDTAYYNQIKGKSMTTLFRNNEIYQNDVTGNVQTIFYNTEQGEKPVVSEMVYLESASASFYIEDKELVGVTYRNDIPFKFYPIDQVPDNQERRLPGFKWVSELRPTRENTFNRTIRPSEREDKGSRKRPSFSIVEKMDRHKEQLMRDGVWYDREDELSPDIIEWRDSREP
ncbi:MAG: hypothetical protein IKY80_06345 [Alistipes sp.]|nr:hypothetical protein [Alistipes sp.]